MARSSRCRALTRGVCARGKEQSDPLPREDPDADQRLIPCAGAPLPCAWGHLHPRAFGHLRPCAFGHPLPCAFGRPLPCAFGHSLGRSNASTHILSGYQRGTVDPSSDATDLLS